MIYIKDKEALALIKKYHTAVLGIGGRVSEHDLLVKFICKNMHLKIAKAQYSLYRKKEYYNIWREQNKKCYFCKVEMAKVDVTIDHLTPKIRGGNITDRKNLVACCEKCNQDKGRLTEFEYKVVKIIRKIDNLWTTHYPSCPTVK